MVVNRPGAGPAGALLSLNNVVPSCEAQSYECENSHANDSDALSVHTGLSHDPMLHRPEPQGNRSGLVSSSRTYTPALRFHRLTGAYDWVVSRTMPEQRVKTELIRQSRLLAGYRILDFGCGTATLTLMVEAAEPAVETVVGVDVDARALRIGLAKAAARQSKVQLLSVSPGPLPFQDCSFDRVLSCLVFHHLRRADKLAALKECWRVLRPGGEIHVADWGVPANIALRAGFLLTQLLDGFETTTDHVRGLLPDFVQEAGFLSVTETAHFATAFGSLRLIQGVRDDNGATPRKAVEE